MTSMQAAGDPGHRRRRTAWRRSTLAVALACTVWAGDAAAQSPGCTMQPAAAPPPRQVLRCTDGLTIEAEAGADYALRATGTASLPQEVLLRRGAVLVNAPAQPRARSFQVLTPQAVAAVRGTEWAVDVVEGRTSVFVREGQVAVRRPNARGGVTLGPGEGVDVAADRAPLTVRRWSPERAAALLARFGR